jgi:FMN-dependent NADH-azoreductase
MPTLLTINASPRGAMSISRRLGERYIHHWLAAHPGGTVAERDLMKPAIPYMNVDWIGGVYAPPAVPRTPETLAALTLSETLIGELVNADQVLICTPMYNYSIPAVLKSWIDYLVRPGFTFKLAPGWPGMLADKPTRILIATRDVHDPESVDDQVTPVIRRAFSFMGIRDVASLLAGGSLGVNRGEVRLEDHVARFEQAIAALVA